MMIGIKAPEQRLDADLTTDEHDVVPAVNQPDDEMYVRQTLEMVGALKHEARAFTQEAELGSYSIEDEWSHNAGRFLGNYDTRKVLSDGMQENFRVITSAASGSNYSGLKRATLMRTQNSIMSNVAAAFSSPVTGRVDPVELGLDDTWYLTPRAGRVVYGLIQQAVDGRMVRQREGQIAASQTGDPDQMQAVADRMMDAQAIWAEAASTRFGGVTIDQLIGDPQDQGPAKPIDEDQYDALQYLTKPGVDPQTGQPTPAVLKDTDFIAITDKFVSRQLQSVCDLLTDEHQMQMYWLLNELNSETFGFQCGSFDWVISGEHKNKFEFDNVHPLNIFTDPSHFDLNRRTYHMEERLVDLDMAVNQWPDHADKLRDAASAGRQGHFQEFDLGGISDNVEFGRKMLRVTLCWVRHQQVPMKTRDAVDEGLVLEVGDGTYTLPDGEPTEPTEDVRHGTNWPNGPGLRQIVLSEQAEVIMQDIRCPHWDIPRVWNINIPRPDNSPFGQGEPIRLRHIDDILNRTVTIIVNHLALLPFPTYFWPADTLRRLKSHAVGIHLRPNVHLPMNRADWLTIVQNGGFKSTRHDAPPIPSSIVNLLDFFLREHDASSGNTDVRQGRTPFSGASGKTISELRQAGETNLSIKSAFLEYAVVRFYKLLIHSVINFLPESEWAKMMNKYKLPVIREVMRRASLSEWNVTVQISTGKGKEDQFKQDRALLMYQQGLQSRETTMMDLGVDDVPDEVKRMTDEAKPQEPGQADPAAVAAQAQVQAQQAKNGQPAQQTVPQG